MTEQMELIVVAYNEIKRAAEVLKAAEDVFKKNKALLEVSTAVAIEKDIRGQTKAVSLLESKQKRGTRIGAAAGGVLAVLAGPVGVAGLLVGALAGAATGRHVTKKPEQQFSNRFLQGVIDNMRGASSALIILTAAQYSEEIHEKMAAFGGTITHHLLTDAEMKALSQGAETSDEETVVDPQTAEKTAQIITTLQEGTRGSGPQFNNVHVIINPASGQDQPILNTLNSVFRAAGLDWDISITYGAGDATRLAAEAAAAGVDIVAVYGGDGAVMEAASGLIGTGVPLAILPGGTNNVVSVELGIAKELVGAAALLGGASSKLRTVDMGRANDKHNFILRVGMGYEAEINKGADREMKDKYGGFAYSIAGLKALKNPPIATYRMELDGEVVEMEGLWCMVANSASLGIPGVNLVHDIDVGDGLLDVIMVRERDLSTLVSVAGSVTNSERIGKPLPHWQVREARISAEPPMAVTGDGELWEPTPLYAKVIPAAVQILVPA